MKKRSSAGVASPIDLYVEACTPEVQAILRKIRAIIRSEAPAAVERISYRMPAFFLNGALIYFAPFKTHIGIYPPVKGNPSLNKALARHRGPRGNLRFNLGEPMPYALIRRVVQCRIREHDLHVAKRKRGA